MKKTAALILTLVLTFSLCACGSSSAAYKSYEGYEAAAPAMAYDSGEVSYSYAVTDSAAGGFAANSSAGTAAPDEKPTDDLNVEKIIYSADATVETTEFDAAVEALGKLIESCGGFIESSSVSGANYYSVSRGYSANRTASYTIRIPSERFGEVMSTLSTLGNVPYSHTYTTNITAQYYDTAARLTSYQAQEQTLIELLDRAESVEDVISVQSALADVRYEIESLQSTLRNWDRRVSYSSLSLTLEEVKVYTPETTLSFGEKLQNAFRSGFVNFREGVKDFILWFAESLPTLVLLAVILVIVFPLTKKLRVKCKARRAAKAEAKAAKKAAKAGKTENSAADIPENRT